MKKAGNKARVAGLLDIFAEDDTSKAAEGGDSPAPEREASIDAVATPQSSESTPAPGS